MQSMTPEQALEFLDQIVQQVAMNREQHVRAQLAVRVLLQAIGRLNQMLSNETKKEAEDE